MTKRDPLFWKKFKISTQITYLLDYEIEKEAFFHKKWNARWKRWKEYLTPTRKRAFDAYFRRLKREGDDAFCAERLDIRFISKKVGFGVFAKVKIPPYTTLGHYVGVIRLDKEIDPENDSTFSFGNFPLFAIDGQEKGNWTRFINHSQKGNVIAWEYNTKEAPYIVFTAGSKGIKKGEQLLYAYGENYWHDMMKTELEL